MPILVDVLSYGTGSHTTSSEAANALATDIFSDGVVGTLGNSLGVAPETGAFAVNAQGTPDTTVAVTAGVAYVTGTPTSQGSQRLRVKLTANQNITIAANVSGSTRYDWIYIKLDPTNMANPNTAADNVATLVTSRSTSNATDNGTPPTYGYCIAIVTVANGFATIVNGNITDKRSNVSASVAASRLANSSEFLYDFVASGCVWSGDAYASTRNASMTSGVVYIGGKRLTVAAVTARSFTASKDTYVDLSDNGDGTALITYTEATNNAASPALNAGSLRIAIIVTGATNIAAAGSVNQGQETMVLPIASSIPYAVTDSLGNLICPRDPNRKVIGYRQLGSDQGSITTAVDVTGVSVPVIVPSGRKIQLIGWGNSTNATTDGYNQLNIYEGASQLSFSSANSRSGSASETLKPEFITSPTAGLHTYKLTAQAVVGTMTLKSAAYLLIMLV